MCMVFVLIYLIEPSDYYTNNEKDSMMNYYAEGELFSIWTYLILSLILFLIEGNIELISLTLSSNTYLTLYLFWISIHRLLLN